MEHDFLLEEGGCKLTIVKDGHPIIAFETTGPGAFAQLTNVRVGNGTGEVTLVYSDGTESESMSVMDLFLKYPGHIRSYSLESIAEAQLVDRKTEYEGGYNRDQMIVHYSASGEQYVRHADRRRVYRMNRHGTIDIIDETPLSMERRAPVPKVTPVDRSVWRKTPNAKNYKQKTKYLRKRKSRK